MKKDLGNIEYPYIVDECDGIVERLLFCPIIEGKCKENKCLKFSNYRYYTKEERERLLMADNPAGCYAGVKCNHCTILMKCIRVYEIQNDQKN